MNDQTLHHRDPDSESLIEQLDALSAENRSVPDAGFEQRILDSISDQIAPAPLPLTDPAAQSLHQRDMFVPGWKFNAAAAILVIGSLSVLLWTSTKSSLLHESQPSQRSLVSLEEDIDALFELTDFADSISTDLDELDLITEQMHTELSLPSVIMDLANNSLEGSL